MLIDLLDKTIDTERSEVLADLTPFVPGDWTLIKHAPKWTVTSGRIAGGSPDEPTHGQVFYRRPFAGDVLLEFEARIIPPSYHDLVWFWNTRFDAEPWSAGYLGCLAGWWSNSAGIEKLPAYVPSAIAPSHATEPGKWYHIVSGSCGPAHFIVVDGKLVTYFSDADVPDPAKPGYIGFGIYESHAEYAHLRVLRPFAIPRQPVYEPGTRRLGSSS